MIRTTLLARDRISVTEFRCTAVPGDKPFAEQYAAHSISYVRKGSFGCHCRGRFHELVAGSILVGHPGDEYTCTHDPSAATNVCRSSCIRNWSRRSATSAQCGRSDRCRRCRN